MDPNIFTVLRCMENANMTARSSQRLNEMKDVSSRLQKELREISKEEERQKLLDALSDSQTKNAELEKALAELAREQDRIALFERERVLKRAQVAQATAALVYEANWARNRMESEMRQAKLRAMVFNDPLPPPIQPGPATISEIISAPSVAPPMLKSGMKESAGDSRRSSNTQSVGSTVKTTVETPVGLPPTVDVRRNPPPAVITTPAVPVVHQDESFSLSPTIPDEPGITDLVSSAAVNVFSTLMSSYNEYTATAPTNSNIPVPDSVVNPVNQITNTSNDKQRPVVKSRIASTPPLPDQRTTQSSVKFGPKVSSYLPPRSPEDTSLKVRAIRNSSKGEWTNPQLLTEAEVTMTMLMQERDELFWTNKLLLEKIFGLPDGTHMPPVNPKFEWIELEEFWIQKAAKLGPSDTAKKHEKISIDSLIAEKAGVDSKVLTDGGDVGAEKNEVEKPPEPVPVAQPAEPGGPKKKKNGCVIM